MARLNGRPGCERLVQRPRPVCISSATLVFGRSDCLAVGASERTVRPRFALFAARCNSLTHVRTVIELSHVPKTRLTGVCSTSVARRSPALCSWWAVVAASNKPAPTRQRSARFSYLEVHAPPAARPVLEQRRISAAQLLLLSLTRPPCRRLTPPPLRVSARPRSARRGSTRRRPAPLSPCSSRSRP